MLVDMIDKRDKFNSNNVLIDFYIQLGQIRDVNTIAFVNAVSSDSNELSTVVKNSIKIERWMNQVSLVDIRTIIVFVLWKEFHTLISDKEKFSEFNNIKKSTLGLNIKKLGVTLETIYYIYHIFYIKKTNTIPGEPLLFHDFIQYKYNKEGLIKIVDFLYNLIKPLI